MALFLKGIRMPAKRRPQINFQVDPCMKTLYEESRNSGHWVTRLCAAGLLLLVEDPAIRLRAINRLREWEVDYADATPDEIREFVQRAQAGTKATASGGRTGTKTRRTKKKTKRS
jgi:hypothetical protein